MHKMPFSQLLPCCLWNRKIPCTRRQAQGTKGKEEANHGFQPRKGAMAAGSLYFSAVSRTDWPLIFCPSQKTACIRLKSF